MATVHNLADQVQRTTWEPWADIHETHSGVVVLLGDRALKFKKPVDLGFLDSRPRTGAGMPASARWSSTDG